MHKVLPRWPMIFLAEFKLTGEDVGRMIPANSQVDLTVATGPDSSLPVKVTLFFPALDEEVELGVPSSDQR